MSLLRLLTTGKSLVGLKKLENRYHLPNEKAIPQFGSKKNPFRATVFPEKVESSDAQAEQDIPSSTPVSAAEEPGENTRQAAELQPGQCLASAGRASNSPQPATNAKDSGIPARRPSALRALLLWGRARKSITAGPAHGRPLIQAELSLDSIKVVRNDLSESDLEVVPLERAQTAQPAEQAEPVLGFRESSRSSGLRPVCEADPV